jgi:hypothetical protein
MTTVETEALGEFDLDIPIDETAPPVHGSNPWSNTFVCSCSACCPSQLCTFKPGTCTNGCK